MSGKASPGGGIKRSLSYPEKMALYGHRRSKYVQFPSPAIPPSPRHKTILPDMTVLELGSRGRRD